jgi:hypothetical protein
LKSRSPGPRNNLTQVGVRWNIRGSFKIGGVVDIGAQVSLARRASGKFVFLDSYSLSDAVTREVGALTDDGKDIEAILS